MNSTWETELSRVAALTFEELCFLFPDFEADAQQDEVSLDTAACVTFWGPFNGRLVVKLYGNLLPSLAANMLGEDKPPSEDQQHDALCEVANVVCGNVLPRIGGSQEIFNLNPPEIVASDAPVGNGPVPLMAKVRFDFEEGRAELFLFAQQAEQASVEEL